MVEASNQDGALLNAFIGYCSGVAGKADTMEGKTFAKLCKDLKLLDKKFTSTDVDLIFAKIKEKAARKITFQEFCSGLQLIAEKKGVSLEQIKGVVANSDGVHLTGTKADNVKFHDDKSLYTGIHHTEEVAKVTHTMGNLQVTEEVKTSKPSKQSKTD